MEFGSDVVFGVLGNIFGPPPRIDQHSKYYIWAKFHTFHPILTIFLYMSQLGSTILVLVSPCFRENVVVTCKIGSFLWSLLNLLQKNVILFSFLKIKFQINTCILLTLLTLFALPIKKKKNIRYGFSLVWDLVLILIRAILEQSINNKMVSKI